MKDKDWINKKIMKNHDTISDLICQRRNQDKELDKRIKDEAVDGEEKITAFSLKGKSLESFDNLKNILDDKENSKDEEEKKIKELIEKIQLSDLEVNVSKKDNDRHLESDAIETEIEKLVFFTEGNETKRIAKKQIMTMAACLTVVVFVGLIVNHSLNKGSKGVKNQNKNIEREQSLSTATTFPSGKIMVTGDVDTTSKSESSKNHKHSKSPTSTSKSAGVTVDSFTQADVYENINQDNAVEMESLFRTVQTYNGKTYTIGEGEDTNTQIKLTSQEFQLFGDNLKKNETKPGSDMISFYVTNGYVFFVTTNGLYEGNLEKKTCRRMVSLSDYSISNERVWFIDEKILFLDNNNYFYYYDIEKDLIEKTSFQWDSGSESHKMMNMVADIKGIKVYTYTISEVGLTELSRENAKWKRNYYYVNPQTGNTICDYGPNGSNVSSRTGRDLLTGEIVSDSLKPIDPKVINGELYSLDNNNDFVVHNVYGTEKILVEGTDGQVRWHNDKLYYITTANVLGVYDYQSGTKTELTAVGENTILFGVNDRIYYITMEDGVYSIGLDGKNVTKYEGIDQNSALYKIIFEPDDGIYGLGNLSDSSFMDYTFTYSYISGGGLQINISYDMYLKGEMDSGNYVSAYTGEEEVMLNSGITIQ